MEVLSKGLPANLDAERFTLGSILMDADWFPIVAQTIQPDEFSLEKHRRIFARMGELFERGEKIDRVTLANELMSHKQLESVDGLAYLASLDDGLPQTFNIESYIRIVKDKAILRKIIVASQATLNAALAPGAVPTEVIAASGVTALGAALDTKGQMIAEYIAEYPGGVSRMLDPSRWDRGIPTGFSVLDEWTDGFHPSEIFLIGARPGVGKSSIGLDISRSLAKRGNLVMFFSMEMPKKICVDRLICENARVSFQRFRAGTLREEERQGLVPAASAVNAWPIFFDDSSALTVPQINMRIQSVATKRPVALCVVDYVQLLRVEKGQRYNTENDRFESIGNALQNMAKQTGIPLLLLSQLTRASTKTADKRPALSDCRGSGVWEQIANLGAVLHRESLYKRNRPEILNLCECIVDKNRGGPSGVINLRFDGPWLSFSDEGA